MFFDSLLFSLSVTLPTILMLVIGIILRYQNTVDDSFCEVASKLVFNISLPAFLFINIVKHPADYGSQLWLISTGLIGSIVLYLLGEWLAFRYITDRRYRGIFVQGMFRGNTGILGLALCINAYGTIATAPGAVYTAFITLLFNILAVITLTNSLGDGKPSFIKIFKGLAKNPLIIAILLGILVSKMEIVIPEPLLRTSDYLAHIALPLALICAGANLNFKQLKQLQQTDSTQSVAGKVVLWTSFGRLFIAPIIMILIGKFVMQLDPMSLGMIFLMSATPLAAAGYSMVRNFGGDSTATANLIAITTLGSMFTSSLGLLLLRQIGWI
ncbi:malonate transporter [Pasteurellaceae bacterium 15-036681]|nr:malonate transporter [Pasteurellaceae bacterium 15-036681]